MPVPPRPPGQPHPRLRAAVAVGIAVVISAGVIVALTIGRKDGGQRPAADAARTAPRAPLAPPRVPRPRPAPESQPERGTAAREATGPQLGLPVPSGFSQGSAARTLAEFMDAWHNRQWERAVLWTAFSWRSRFAEPVTALQTRFAPRRLRGWAIIGERLQRARGMFTILVVDLPRLRNQLERRRVLVNIRRESPSGVVSGSGRWGVDPSSIRPLPGR